MVAIQNKCFSEILFFDFLSLGEIKVLKMPLVLITGIPSSGKTTTSLKLKTYLEEKKGCKVHLVSENEILTSEGDKNDILSDSKKEKSIRGAIKSESIRLLTKDSVVICDGLNYIKGKNIEHHLQSRLPMLSMPKTIKESIFQT